MRQRSNNPKINARGIVGAAMRFGVGDHAARAGDIVDPLDLFAVLDPALDDLQAL